MTPARVRRRALLPIAALALAGCTTGDAAPPPDTRVEPVTDTIHGVAFTDPYRWLEDQDAPETRAWIAAQNAYTEQVIGPSPLRDAFATRWAELVDVPDVGSVRTEGDWQYFTMRRRGEELPVVYRRPAADSTAGDPTAGGTYEAVLDPVTVDPTHRTLLSLAGFSDDGRLMMYQVRLGGSDEVEVRFRETETLQDLPDRLPRALYGGVRFVDDGRAIEYTHRDREIGPRIVRHVFGTDASEDVVLWGEEYGPETFIGVDVVDDGRLRVHTARHGWARGDVYLQRAGGPMVPVVSGVDAHFDPQYRDGVLWIVTDWRAPLARLVRVDPARPDTAAWVTVLPEAELPLDDVSFIEGRIYARYIDDVAHRIRVFELDGTPAGEVDVPSLSSVSLSDAPGEGTATLTVEGHLQPETGYALDLTTGERSVSDPSEVPFDPAGFEVAQVWATSADGTRVPIYAMHRAGLRLDGSHPTILTGYGGFDVASMPGFSATAATWVEMGGVWAVATLRGGSEFGEAWHRGGMLENKQRVFDDFIAASEHLIELGYTSPEHLGIWGASNGGLLVAAAMTQRPELYRAVYCGFPDLDMLRFNTFTRTNNMPALLEYGDASIPSHFEAIRHYSPYQAIEDGVAYPAVMLTTGDLDTRVPPLQARRMAARLQAATASGLPVVLWYDEMGGHAASRGRPLSLQVRDTARELAFMGEQLGLAERAGSR
jgi:prolyl oligopeptidase